MPFSYENGYQSNNILASVNDSDRREILSIMEHAVVSTDLALHLKYGYFCRDVVFI